MDRGKQGTKRSLLVDGNGIPLGCVAAGANRNDSLLLAPTLEKLSRFGFDLPERITVHLDAGYDSGKTRELLATLGCDGIISTKGEPLRVHPDGELDRHADRAGVRHSDPKQRACPLKLVVGYMRIAAFAAVSDHRCRRAGQ